MTGVDTLVAYFGRLAAHGRAILDALPIQPEIRPIAETFAVLTPAIAALRPTALRDLAAIARPAPPRGAPGPVGMNSIGILADRLTILLCKQFYLRHRQDRPDQAAAIGPQIADIVACLALAHPGDPALLQKVGTLSVGTASESFAAAYFDLLAANLLMWETQELLYTRDMEGVPGEELRDYIRFFSQSNLLRNRHIAESERLYWADVAATGEPASCRR